MTVEQAFDKRIKKFLDEQPNSSASKTIRQIERTKPSFTSHYSLFDDFTYRLGFGMIAVEVVNEKVNKISRYIPNIKYYPDNLLNEIPRIEPLGTAPLNLIECYTRLAEEILYRIMRIKDLDELLNSVQRKL